MPPDAVEVRLQRLLGIILEYGDRVDGVPIVEVLERFGAGREALAREALQRDLDVAGRCGVPPYELADELINAFVDEDDDRLYVLVPDVFTRHRRLTAGEGLAVLTAAATVLELRPDEKLAAALDKLRAALGGAAGADLSVTIDRPPCLAVLLEADEDHRVVRGRYWSASRDAVRERTLEPHHVFYGSGAWYARCRDRDDGQVKLFRVDRFESAALTGERFEAGEVDESVSLFRAGVGAESVRVRFPAQAAWVRELESVAIDDAAAVSADGSFEATLAVAADAWLASLLLRTGGVVLEPASLRTVGPDAARRALAHYDR